MRHDTACRCPALRRVSHLCAVVAISIAACSVAAIAQEYRLQAGDVIEFSVTGIPEMGTRAAIQIDGSLSFPGVGVIKAAGRPISEIRDRIGATLSSRLRMIFLPDGSQVTRVVEYDDVSASVVEYRPVFVSGDVTQPGERPFRPGMTVRQVIAASGGVISVVPITPGYNPSALRSDYTVAWNAAVAASARVWRLKKELGEDVEFDRSAWPAAPERDDAIDIFLRVESDIYETRTKNLQNESGFLSAQLKQIESQADVMRKEFEVEKAVEQTDADALTEATNSIKKGILTTARLQDFRSAALFSSTRRLQTQVSLMQLERQRNDISRESERAAEQRRLDLLDELQKARLDAAQQRARLIAADERLREMGVAPVSLAEGAEIPQITVFHSDAEAPEPVSFDSKIEPGDVIEVKRTADAPPLTAWMAPDTDLQPPATLALQ
ncbi:polysaccharide biosynthesis/export family protein [Cypionkella psychrotolerans]|uniref:polysaccharide biosynthesis/export family protein n=1 Tax=Cypionkella psychrotolerans TaxID=1678131 RepID=UPI0006B52FF3|nr:polysaccharide biosynthesis/export family protein [Cypionkella psychrotolerans]